jgi:hypothetical protein
MARYLISAVLPALMFLGTAGPAAAQWLPPPPLSPGFWRGPDLSGTYVNTSNGGGAQVYRRGRGYVFVNENGTPAQFEFVGPGRLRMVSGDWDPNVTVFVERDRYGRLVLRFQGPRDPPGYWVRQE